MSDKQIALVPVLLIDSISHVDDDHLLTVFLTALSRRGAAAVKLTVRCRLNDPLCQKVLVSFAHIRGIDLLRRC